MENFNIVECKNTIDSILKELPQRNQQVIARRFGINENSKNDKNLAKPETLESIGKDFGITRERVRQIENKGLEMIQTSPYFSSIEKSLIEIKNFIDNNGGLKKEESLAQSLAPQPELQPYLLFILRIGQPFLFQPDSPAFYSLWKTMPKAHKIAEKIVQFLIEFMEKEKRTFQRQEILEIGKEKISKSLKLALSENYLDSYIEATKKIEENPFGEYGPAWWPEINPKCVRDKAYLILKKENKPLHFQELAKKIEEQLQRPVQINTLHNELIKNQEFVLVGRGIYGLKEWGYKDGTVKEIIEEVLKEKGPLTREEVLNEVKKQRLVEGSTILLNLQHFKRTEDGKYKIEN